MSTSKKDNKKSFKTKKAISKNQKQHIAGKKKHLIKKDLKKRITGIKIDKTPTPSLNSNVNSVLSWFLPI